MSDGNLRTAFLSRKPMLEALGAAAVSRLSERIQQRIGEVPIEYFLKIPPTPRVKGVDSFMEKTTRKGKNYPNPLEDITDQVGCRFVVLREDHTIIVNQAIEDLKGWDLSKDKDIQQVRLDDPHHFDYLSDHWVIRPRTSFEFQGIMIPLNTPCEIQVRTLLQHAYAELAHSATYKPTSTRAPEVRRAIGRGAALVETTDSVFVEVGKMIDQATAEVDGLLRGAGEWFSDQVKGGKWTDPFSPIAFRIVDAYRPAFGSETWETIAASFQSIPWLAEHLRENGDLPLYSEPVILLVFFLVNRLAQQMPQDWILPRDYLAPIFSALGMSPGDSLDG